MSTELSPVAVRYEYLTHLPSRIDAVIDQALYDHRLVGTVVMVSHQGTLRYCRAAGLADRESALPMATDTLFRLASVSKPIVSTAAMVLVAQGKLGLEDDIRRWLPDFAPRLPQGEMPLITLRHLLSHTAGLSYRFLEPDHQSPYALAGISDGMDSSTHSLQENLRRLAGVELLYAPGTSWNYSLATDVVGAVIEAVCQQPLADVVAQRVTGPLAMADTAFTAVDVARLSQAYVSDTPAPHILQEGEIVAPFEGTVGIPYSPARALDPQAFASGGAGMVGSAGDLMRLLEVLRQGGAPLLPADLVAQMGRDQTNGRDIAQLPACGFGLGFSILRDPQAIASPESPGTWRWGGAYGHSWFVDPTQQLSVVALTNTLYEGMSGQFVTDLRDAVYGVTSGVAK
ncbi:serine hydrolase domain-containing protein [Ewingella americana]|uniref:Class A beta-lactamase-related serine hydrolase n=1 Tax=Ewingella americana TaxID=41202 RepID=A0A502G9C7_9GAMM|nr:serine hydrolase domain-containing protein [Ewingella americana]TPG57636.1 class A beta-lactamase-related serine hydrolase [Ewingella americana]